MAGVFIHVQHLLGSGHLHRCARIADCLAAQGISVTLCSGGRPSRVASSTAGWRLVQLEPLHCPPDFSQLLDDHDEPVDAALWQRRQRQLNAAMRESRPDVMLIESFPFARRQFGVELLPLLEFARNDRLPVYCSIRDILQPKTKPERAAETIAVLDRLFDGVLVHGDVRVAELALSFPAADRMSIPVTYTGYVAPEIVDGDSTGAPAQGDDEVLVSAGGGAVGDAVLEAAMALCRAGALREHSWRFLLGQAASASLRLRLQEQAPANALVVDAVPAFPAMLRRCALSISQAGYNTMVDVLAAGCRAVVVPYAEHGEREQELRARRLHDLGLVTQWGIGSSTELGDAVSQCLARPRSEVEVDLSGAQRTAKLLAEGIDGAAR